MALIAPTSPFMPRTGSGTGQIGGTEPRLRDGTPLSEGRIPAERTPIDKDTYQITYGINPDAFRFAGGDQARRSAQDILAGQFGRANFGEGLGRAIADLRKQSQGRGPSVALDTFRTATEENLANQFALAAQARGPQAALASRQAGFNQAQIGQQAARQAGQIRAQEILGARAQLVDAYAQQGNLRLQQQQQLNQFASFYESLGLSRDQAQIQAAIELEKLRSDTAVQEKGIKENVGIANRAADAQFTGSVVGALGALGGGLIAASDERVKEGVQSGDAQTQEFLDALSAKLFNYKGSDETQMGVMAQDAEKSKMGADMVTEDSDGVKGFPMDKLVSALMASNALLNKRLNQIEGSKA